MTAARAGCEANALTASGRSSPPADPEEVGADADDRRFGFQPPPDVDQVLSRRRILPPGVEALEEPARAFDAEDLDIAEAGRLQLGAQVPRPARPPGTRTRE